MLLVTQHTANTHVANLTCTISGSLLMAAPTQQQAASAAAQAGMVQMFAYPDLNQAALFQQTALDPVAYAAAASAASAYGLQPHQLQQF